MKNYDTLFLDTFRLIQWRKNQKRSLLWWRWWWWHIETCRSCKKLCENMILTSLHLLVLLYEILNNLWSRPTRCVCGSHDIPNIDRYFSKSINRVTLTQRDALDVTSRLLVNG